MVAPVLVPVQVLYCRRKVQAEVGDSRETFIGGAAARSPVLDGVDDAEDSDGDVDGSGREGTGNSNCTLRPTRWSA